MKWEDIQDHNLSNHIYELFWTIMKIKTNSLEPGDPKDSSDCNIFSIYNAIASEKQVREFQTQYDEGIGWGEGWTEIA